MRTKAERYLSKLTSWMPLELKGPQPRDFSIPLKRLRSKYPLDLFSSRPIRRWRRPKDYIGPVPKRSTLKRLKGKERLTWFEWLCDWRTALHKMGFVCRGDLVGSGRSSETNKGVRRKEALCMVNGDTAIFLYASIHAMPKGQNVDLDAFSSVYRVVKGRRPNASAGAKRLDNLSAAVGIIPDADLDAYGCFFVDFDGGLFDVKDGVWNEAENENLLHLYREYREHSPHYRAIRPYSKAAADEWDFLRGELLENLAFYGREPKFAYIKDLK